ncbi:MAG: ribosomal protein S18-alanine N-acetyltransferase [Thermoplasmata archaeon]
MKDLKAVQDLANISLQESYSLDVYLFINQARNCEFFVYTVGGAVVGFICGLVESPQGARILMIAIHPDHRCKGIGSRMLETFVNSCAKHGTKKITLEVRPSNKNAILFYKKRGFQQQGTIENFYTDGERCINMVRYL